MSVVLTKLLDIEKYLLQQMVYYHLPIEQKDNNLAMEPIPLSDLVEHIIYGTASVVTKKGIDGTTREHTYRKREEFREVLNNSSNLGDVVLRGYINDNYAPDGNTDTKFKTSLVGMCFADSEDNRVVVFSGCENYNKLSFFIDMSGCFLSGFGLPMRQQKAALKFFNKEIRGAEGKIGLIGHSKGGFNATHCYINNLDKDIDVFVIGGQPYNWRIMNEKQRAALKQPNYEFILHDGDVMGQVGYITYVSRIVSVNPYRSRSDILPRHCFDMQVFDDYGNLEGARVLRKTPGAVKRLVFSDYSKEELGTNEDSLERFKKTVSEIDNKAKLISYAIDEIQLVTQADTASFFLVSQEGSGYSMIPVITKGGEARDFSLSRIKVSESKLKNAIDAGLPLLWKDIHEENHLLVELQNTMKKEISSFGIIPVTGEDSKGGIISLATFDDKKLDIAEFEFAFKLVQIVYDRLNTLGFEFDVIPAPPKFELQRLDQPIISIGRAEYKEIFCTYEMEKEELTGIFKERKLSGFEKIKIDRVEINPGEEYELNTWRKKDLTYIYGGNDAKKRRGLFANPPKKDAFLTLDEACSLMGIQVEDMKRSNTKMTAAEYVKASVAEALAAKSPFIVIDAFEMSEEDYMEVMPVLRLVCYDMYSTIMVFRKKAK